MVLIYRPPLFCGAFFEMPKAAPVKRRKRVWKQKKTVVEVATQRAISASVKAFDKTNHLSSDSTHFEFKANFNVKKIHLNRKLMPYEEAIFRQILSGTIQNPPHDRAKQVKFLRKVLYINPTVKTRAEHVQTDII